MSSFFYGKLALTNLKKNSKTYLPYILTCIGTIIMFYNMCALSHHSSTGNGSVASMMWIGTNVTGIFSAIFLFYTNSFLVKRRKKEFGLFNLLGMEKRHIGRIMLWECIYTSLISMIAGLGLGFAFSKLFTLLLYKILKFDPNYGFEISSTAVVTTAVLFGAIFILTLLNNLRYVHTSKPIELLRGSNVGEKEPKTRWLLALIGVITLGIGYGMSLSIESPLKAIQLFFVAVVLVIIGTYCLFTAGSIALLKILKKNKKYYYKTKHFTSVSGMIYRMKQNAVGLANICIMSTAVLVMLSTTVSMFIGQDDVMATRFERDMIVSIGYAPEYVVDFNEYSNGIEAYLSENNMEISNELKTGFLEFATSRDKNSFTSLKGNRIQAGSKMCELVVIPQQEYARSNKVEEKLNTGEVMVFADEAMSSIEIMGKTYTVTSMLDKAPELGSGTAWIVDTVYVIVADDQTRNDIYYSQKEAYGEDASELKYNLAFDFAASDEEIVDFVQNKFANQIYEVMSIDNVSIGMDSRQASEEEFFLLYGGLFFLGIFLGLLFLMATVLIIYYKQIIEGYEDKERFDIMQKVGMSHEEVRKSISTQILTVFTLPIAAAVIHLIVAFPILTKLLAILNLTNVPLFMTCTAATVVAFAVIYGLVYALTAREYYRIVNN